MELIDKYMVNRRGVISQNLEIEWDLSMRVELNLVFSLRCSDSNDRSLLRVFLSIVKSESLDNETRVSALIRLLEELTESSKHSNKANLLQESSFLFLDTAQVLSRVHHTIPENCLELIKNRLTECLEVLMKKTIQMPVFVNITKGAFLVKDFLLNQYDILSLPIEEIELLCHYNTCDPTDLFSLLIKIYESFQNSELLFGLCFTAFHYLLEHKFNDQNLLGPLEENLKKFLHVFTADQLQKLHSSYLKITKKFGKDPNTSIFETGVSEKLTEFLNEIIGQVNNNVWVKTGHIATRIENIGQNLPHNDSLMVQVISNWIDKDIESLENVLAWRVISKAIKQFNLFRNHKYIIADKVKELYMKSQRQKPTGKKKHIVNKNPEESKDELSEKVKTDIDKGNLQNRKDSEEKKKGKFAEKKQGKAEEKKQGKDETGANKNKKTEENKRKNEESKGKKPRVTKLHKEKKTSNVDLSQRETVELSNTCINIISPHCATETIRQNMAMKYTLIKRTVNNIFPKARLETYGSCVLGTWITGSNFNLTLIDDEIDIESAQVLLSHTFRTELLSRGGIPVIRINFEDFQVPFDLTINNKQGIAIRDLVRKCSQFNLKVVQLILFVKIWAKSQGILKENGHYLTLLVINLLQKIEKPILPLINSDKENYCYSLQGNHEENSLSLGCLVLLFFDFYSNNGLGTIGDLSKADLEDTDAESFFNVRDPMNDELVTSGIDPHFIIDSVRDIFIKITANQDLSSFIVLN